MNERGVDVGEVFGFYIVWWVVKVIEEIDVFVLWIGDRVCLIGEGFLWDRFFL